VFEEQARAWVRRYADAASIGGSPDIVGPSSAIIDGKDCQLDVLVAADEGSVSPAERTVLAIGEAKSGETLTPGHLRRLEKARSALGTRAAQAKILLFGASPGPELEAEAAGRADVELVGLDRLYHGG
jgi:hypothetical protein